MKKMTALLIAAGIVLASFGIANAHSEWAKYLMNPVPLDGDVPEKFIIEVCDDSGCDYVVDCCACQNHHRLR